jgi:hypothetical protein
MKFSDGSRTSLPGLASGPFLFQCTFHYEHVTVRNFNHLPRIFCIVTLRPEHYFVCVVLCHFSGLLSLEDNLELKRTISGFTFGLQPSLHARNCLTTRQGARDPVSSVGEPAPARDLLELLDRLDPTIAEQTQAIEREVEKCPATQRLRTHPGVGSLTALAIVLIIGRADRFQSGEQIASYLGLAPLEVERGSATAGTYHEARQLSVAFSCWSKRRK